MSRIYVGNLPYPAREEELRSFFAAAGNVTEVIVPLTEDKRSKGFGFVEFGDDESFKKALAMDGQQMDGRPLRINEARPREERRDGAARPMAQSAPVEDASDEADALMDEVPAADTPPATEEE
jgi:RNA recognition motif-containing protein